MKRRLKRAPAVEQASPEESRELVRRIGAMRLFAKYERSFTAASGLPLTLRPLGAFRMPATGHRRENAFCALMADSRKGCVSCLMTQGEIEKNAVHRACTLRCFAGLHDTLVPIKIGNRVVAYLQTGQVALRPFGAVDFDRAHSELILRSIDVDAHSARTAYLQSRAMERDEYQGFVRMLEIFAETLGAAANALQLERAEAPANPAIAEALKFVRQHLDRRITLGEIAKRTGASERHFSKLFKEATGLTFVDYLTRERVERAKRALRETRNRVSEIAFASGFESIAQFNRSFKKVAGESPSSYRQQAMN